MNITSTLILLALVDFIAIVLYFQNVWNKRDEATKNANHSGYYNACSESCGCDETNSKADSSLCGYYYHCDSYCPCKDNKTSTVKPKSSQCSCSNGSDCASDCPCKNGDTGGCDGDC